MRVGKSKFCSLRPNWIKKITPHDGCACVYHQNPTLMITAWNRTNGQAIDLKEIISQVVCSTSDSTCYSRDCSTCGDRLPSELLLSNFNGNEDDEMKWMRWKRTDK